MEAAVEAGLAAVKAGATILDIEVSARWIGLILRNKFAGCVRSSALREHRCGLVGGHHRAEVAEAALQVGVNAINDVSAGSEDPRLILRRKKDAVWC